MRPRPAGISVLPATQRAKREGGEDVKPEQEIIAMEKMAKALEASGQYRVLRRFGPPESYQLGDEAIAQSRIRSILVVDVETTGLNKDTDKES